MATSMLIGGDYREPARPQAVGEESRNLMDHHGLRQIGQAVQGRVVLAKPRLEGLFQPAVDALQVVLQRP